MEFRVLGPLEVVDGLASVQLGGRKPRAVLALLVIRANRVVATDRLIEDIWDGRPPRSAMTTLQTYVSQLRRLGIVDLRTQAPGYVLEAGPESVDAERFRRAVDADEADETPARTVARLGRALGLWRGRPLAEFEDATWARAEREHLEALRLTAMTGVSCAGAASSWVTTTPSFQRCRRWPTRIRSTSGSGHS